MADPISKQHSSITQRICGILALQAGFHTSSIGALTRLSDVALTHMNEICRLTKLFCENTCRTIPIDKDVELALRYLNVDEEQLVNEIIRLKDNPDQFPSLQVRSANPPNQPKIMRVTDASSHRPSHIPGFLPPFPDPHTYIQTEVSCEPDVSYAKHREMCANHQQNVDNLLISFLTTRYPTISLYGKYDDNSKDGSQRARGLILRPFEDQRPYLTALLPPEMLDELEL